MTSGVAFALLVLVAMTRPTGSLKTAPAIAPAPIAADAALSATRVPTLALPSGVADVELSAFPDWLANEPPSASLRAVVAVRGTLGIASAEGLAVVNWTERGISYRLASANHTVAELVRLADALP